MDDHIAKPFTLAELGRVFGKWIANPAPRATPAAGEPTVSPKGNTYAVLDVEALHELSDLQIAGEPSIVDRLIDSFVETAPQQLQDITSRLAADDLKGVTIAAHGMKSASRQIGLPALSDAFKNLEDLASDGNTENIAVAVANVKQLMGTALGELSRFKAEASQ